MLYQGGPIPMWTLKASVIGYTMLREITETEAEQQKFSSRPALHPTIYYTLGHLTVQHEEKVGWTELGGICEFFGNVRNSDADKLPAMPSQNDVDALVKKYPDASYCKYHPAWTPNWTLVAHPAEGERLVEVWRMGPVRVGHRSRYRFYWAGTDKMKAFLQKLVEAASKVAGAPSEAGGSGRRAMSPYRGPSGRRR